MRRRHRSRSGRPVNGILLLDKPAGITSNAALQTVKRLLRARKAGHTGSLDPLATGMLPICLGEATKISGFLLEADKTYEVEIRLGVTTSTGDAEGETVEQRPVPPLSRDLLEQVLDKFRGGIEQVPPMHSAIKRNGQPLYKLAHQGIVVEREPRRIHIHELRLLEFHDDRLRVHVHCSKGTYIRTLAEDIGTELGCGGHVSALRRTGVGGFDPGDMVTLETLEAAVREGGPEAAERFLLPLESGLGHWPAVRLSDEVAYFLRQGQAVFVPHAPTRGHVRIYGGDGRFLGVGRILDDGRVAPKRLLGQ